MRDLGSSLSYRRALQSAEAADAVAAADILTSAESASFADFMPDGALAQGMSPGLASAEDIALPTGGVMDMDAAGDQHLMPTAADVAIPGFGLDDSFAGTPDFSHPDHLDGGLQ